MSEKDPIDQALQLIISHQISSQGLYSQKYQHPTVPCPQTTSSGVTIGVGYDLGHVEEEEFRRDWTGKLSQESIESLSKMVGLKGMQAKQRLQREPKVKSIKVPYQTAVQVFRTKVQEKYIPELNKKFNCREDYPHVYAAMLSCVYNRGSSLSEKDTRKEMREISQAINGKIKIDCPLPQFVSSKLKQMKRLWKQGGLLRRRDEQASLCLKDLGSKKKANLFQEEKHNKAYEKLMEVFDSLGKRDHLKDTKDYINKVLDPFNLYSFPVSKQDPFNALINDKINNRQKDKHLAGVCFNPFVPEQKFNGIFKGLKQVLIKQTSSAGFRMSHLFTPLRLMKKYNNYNLNLAVSLDPLIPDKPDGPLYKSVYYPPQLGGTIFGQKMIEADYLMKQLNLGVDQNEKPFRYPKQLMAVGFGVDDDLGSKVVCERNRLWIVVKDFKLDVVGGHSQIVSIKMGLQAKRQEIGEDGCLKDSEEELSARTKKFIRLFTEHYGLLEEAFPIYREIREMAMASIMASLVIRAGIPLDLEFIDQLEKSIPNNQNQNKRRLQNKIVKEVGSTIYTTKLMGGCSLAPPLLDQHIKTATAIVKDQKLPQHLNSYLIKRGQLSQATTDVDQVSLQEEIYLSQFSYQPFPYLLRPKCVQCKQQIVFDQAVLQTNKCLAHSGKQCSGCLKVIQHGQPYFKQPKPFHSQCFKCKGCKGHIKDSFVSRDDFFYHVECVPKRKVGECSYCNLDIVEGTAFYTLNDGKSQLHQQCKRLFQGVCSFCSKEFEGAYVDLGSHGKYHDFCIICFKCSKPIKQGVGLLDNMFVHSGPCPQ